MTTYERVRFNGRTVILRDPVELEAFGVRVLSGVHVDLEGSEVAPAGVDERRHIIELALITRRTPMRMSTRYATLEVDHDEQRRRKAAGS